MQNHYLFLSVSHFLGFIRIRIMKKRLVLCSVLDASVICRAWLLSAYIISWFYLLLSIFQLLFSIFIFHTTDSRLDFQRMPASRIHSFGSGRLEKSSAPRANRARKPSPSALRVHLHGRLAQLANNNASGQRGLPGLA